MHIGILQAGHMPDLLRPAHGDTDDLFMRLLAGHGLTFRSWDAENLVFPASVHDAEGWLITGSKHGVYEDHAFIPPLERFVRDARDAAVRVVGICFGHQIVAQALGGRVEKFADGWALGRHDYAVTGGGGGALRLNAWHQDQVVEAPPGAEVLASSPFCSHAALVYGDAAFTIQAHPEFADALIGDFVATRRESGLYPQDRMQRALDAMSTQPIEEDRARAAAAIARFFKTGEAHV